MADGPVRRVREKRKVKMADAENLPCEHGRQRRACEVCALEKAEARILELEKLAVEAAEALKLKDMRLAECEVREKGMSDMALLLMDVFGFGGPEHKDVGICEFASSILREQYSNLGRLLEENNNLRWQVNNWERKEVHKASCCSDNEDQVKSLTSKLSEAQAANERDRSRIAQIVTRLGGILRGYSWIAEGRGPYDFDDDQYQAEFGRALNELEKEYGNLSEISHDLTNCPETQAEVEKARARVCLDQTDPSCPYWKANDYVHDAETVWSCSRNLEDENKNLVKRLSDAHLANDKLRDEMRDLREDHAYVTGEDWMAKYDNLSIEFVNQRAQEEKTLQVLHDLMSAFIEMNPRYGVFSGWQSLFSAVRKDYAQLVEETQKFGREMTFHLCKPGEIKPYPCLLCSKGCTGTDFNVLEALKHKNDRKIQKHLTEAKAEMDRTHGSWLTVREHIDAVLSLIDWQETSA